MVVPSAICVPHPLQKAIDVPPVIVQLGPWTEFVRPYLDPAKVIRISLPRQTESQGRGFKRSRSGDGTGRALPVNTIPVIGRNRVGSAKRNGSNGCARGEPQS